MTTEGVPIHVTTECFQAEAIDSDIPVVVDFWAPWCGPCRAIAPVLDVLASRYAGKVKVVKVNVDEEPQVAGAFKVRSIPTVLGMDGGEVVDVQVGFAGQPGLERLFDTLAERAEQAA